MMPLWFLLTLFVGHTIPIESSVDKYAKVPAAQVLSTFQGDSFELTFLEPTDKLAFYANLLVESGFIEEAVAGLEETFALPIPIRIVFGPGLEGPQYFQGVISMPYDFLLQNDQILAASAFTDDPEEAKDILLNITEFVMYHEVGHALVDVLDLPVLGKEEDAVDGFAAILSTLWELDEITLSAADIFDATSSLSAGNEITAAEFWDSHSLDEQRMYALFCLIYGSNPEAHSVLADDLEMPDEKRNECQYDYQRSLRNWTMVLSPYLRNQ